MDYEFELHPPDSYLPETDASGTHAIEFTLGYLPAENTIIVMSVMLVPTDAPNVFEICFGIRRKELRGDVTYVSEPDYSKDGVNTFIPAQYRARVHSIITDCTFHLTEEVFPDYIVMETFYPNLPAKALTKYEPIVEAIIRCGYQVEQQFRHSDGIDYWSFRNEYGASS